MEKTAVVVFSGGQDSTTVLLELLEADKYKQIHTITYSYGQRHSEEVKNAGKLIELLERDYPEKELTNIVVDASYINAVAPSNYLTDEDKQNIEYHEKGIPSTFVPGRNIVFFSMAAMYAYNRGSKSVYVGVSEADFSGYPDCTSSFIEKMQTALNEGLDNNIKIKAPLMESTKKDVWHRAHEMNRVEFIRDETITCYEGIKGTGCQECPACELRSAGYENFVMQNHEINKQYLGGGK